jgi:transcriptional regulator with XRE-family HTH domain
MSKLKEWCRANQKSVPDFAREIGIAPNYLYEMEGGKRVPSLKVAVAIAKLTGNQVPCDYWLENAASEGSGAAS